MPVNGGPLAGDWQEYERERVHIFSGTYTYKCHRCKGVFEHVNAGRKRGYCDPCRVIKKNNSMERRRREKGERPAFKHSPEVKAAILHRWENNESARHIAQSLGLASKNVVIGLIHRMGKSNTRPRPKRDPNDRPVKRKRYGASKAALNAARANMKRPKPVAMPSSLIAPAPLSYTKPVIDLDAYLANKGCKWLNDDGPCGKPMWEHSKIYCEHHAAVSTRRA